MHTSLPSLRPPQSGGAVRGFAAAVSCYDVKTTTPLSSPPFPLVHVPHSPSLDPPPTCCPPAGPLSQSTCWFVSFPPPHHPLELQREGESQITLQELGVIFPQKNIPEISPPQHITQYMHKKAHTHWLTLKRMSEHSWSVFGGKKINPMWSALLTLHQLKYTLISNAGSCTLYLLSVLTQITVVAAKPENRKRLDNPS